MLVNKAKSQLLDMGTYKVNTCYLNFILQLMNYSRKRVVKAVCIILDIQ